MQPLKKKPRLEFNLTHWDKLNQIKYKYPQTTFINITDISNYLLNDPVIDWLNKHIKVHVPTNKIITNYKNLLKTNGNIFEKCVINKLQARFPDNIIILNHNSINQDNFNETKQAIKDKIPIICTGVLINSQNNTQCIFDIIVRSDWINFIFNRKVITEYVEIHYCVIDIKWTNMNLCSNGRFIRNNDRFPAYKGQLALYNLALGNIQGYYSNQTYILCKSWEIDSKNNPQKGFDCFELAGIVDYNSWDHDIISKVEKALLWINNLNYNGHKWNIFKPTISEMYPNMKNKCDIEWYEFKKNICESINDLTLISYIGHKQRVSAHQRNIYSWRNHNCTSLQLDINGEHYADIVDKIIEVNKSKQKILPVKIKNNDYYWRKTSPNDFYVDFETINELFLNPITTLSTYKYCSDFVFMIGVGYYENDEFKYKNFSVNELSFEDEEQIFDEFINFINDKSCLEYIPRLFHWGNAEITNFKHVNMRHSNKWINSNYCWIDMCKIFMNEPICIKGSLTFKLKDVSKALFNLHLITSSYEDCEISNGLYAMIEAINYYNNKENNNIIDNIIKYNKMDCNVLYDIITFF